MVFLELLLNGHFDQDVEGDPNAGINQEARRIDRD